jgi:hypothetical protein
MELLAGSNVSEKHTASFRASPLIPITAYLFEIRLTIKILVYSICLYL